MKSFKNFLTEEVEPAAFVEKGKVDCRDHAVRDNINILLDTAMSCSHVTPYVALQKAAKVLAMFHITLPKTNFLEGPHGFETFRLQQFGSTVGMKNDGSVVTKVEEPYTLYFEWMQNEKGMFKLFCQIVDDDELSDLLDNAEKEVNDEDPTEDRDEKIYEGIVTKAVEGLKKRQGVNKEVKKYKDVVNSEPGPNGTKTKEQQKASARVTSLARMKSGKTPFSYMEEANKPLVVKARELVDKLKGKKQEPKKETTQGDLLSREASRKRALYKPGLEEDNKPTDKTIAPSDSGGESMSVLVKKPGDKEAKPGFLTQIKEARKGSSLMGRNLSSGKQSKLKSRSVRTEGDHHILSLHGHDVVKKHKDSGEVHFNLQADKTGGRASSTTKTTINDALGEMGIDGRVSVKGGEHYFKGEKVDGNKWVSAK